MNVVIFGATGVVGQGALIECLRAPDVLRVLSIGRRSSGTAHEKLREIVHGDLYDLSTIAADLAGYDACFFCLGVSSIGMSPDDYRRITRDLTLVAAEALLASNPMMSFAYVSGQGTDSTRTSRLEWARVKGDVENTLLNMTFAAAYMFRPAYIHPVDGVVSRTKLQRVLQIVAAPIYRPLMSLFPKYVTTTALVGRAMLNVVRQRRLSAVLENEDINRAGAAGTPNTRNV